MRVCMRTVYALIHGWNYLSHAEVCLHERTVTKCSTRRRDAPSQFVVKRMHFPLGSGKFLPTDLAILVLVVLLHDQSGHLWP